VWHTRFGFDNRRLCPEEQVEFLDRVFGNSELTSQDLLDLGQYCLAQYQIVFSEKDHQEVCAESPGGNRADEDICVETDPQETSRRTSSSVKYPLASAKGRMRRRNSANWVRASWRRNASRARSLRLLPVRRARRASWRWSSGSRRIVKAAVFMLDNVIQAAPPNQRMKLAARGGRVKRKESFLSAAATGCSLCAIR